MIETARLELYPLNVNQLKLWCEDIPSLEKELNCTYQAEPMQGIFHQIVKEQLTATENDPDNYVWHSFWFLILKADRTVVGSADFKDIPNADGEVEIGYGLGKKFEHNGYMTEAVEAMCKWALNQKDVLHVIAETDTDGFASQQVLRNCGFAEYKRDKTIWWKL